MKVGNWYEKYFETMFTEPAKLLRAWLLFSRLFFYPSVPPQTTNHAGALKFTEKDN